MSKIFLNSDSSKLLNFYAKDSFSQSKSNFNSMVFKIVHFDLTIMNRNDVLDTLEISEVVVRRSSVKKIFLKVSQKSQENTYVGFSFLVKV